MKMGFNKVQDGAVEAFGILEFMNAMSRLWVMKPSIPMRVVPAAEHGLVNEYYLLEQNIYQVEVLNQLDQVPVRWCFDFNCISSLGQGDRFPSACSGYFTLNIRKDTEEFFGVFFRL